MFGFILGAVETVAKTAVGLPVAIVADVITVGGNLSGKGGHQTYTGDMMDSIGDSLDDMTD